MVLFKESIWLTWILSKKKHSYSQHILFSLNKKKLEKMSEALKAHLALHKKHKVNVYFKTGIEPFKLESKAK